MKKLYGFVMMLGLCFALVACSKSSAVFNENVVVEYGTEKVDKTILLADDDNNKDIEIVKIDGYDKLQVGVQELTVTLKKSGKEFTQSVQVEIKDTKAPVISIEQETVTIEQGTNYDPKKNIKVADPVDGNIAYDKDKEKKKSTYYYESNVDLETAGTYEVRVMAYDANGNESTAKFTIVVTAKEESYNAPTSNTAPATNNNGYSAPSGGSSYTPPVNNNAPVCDMSVPAGAYAMPEEAYNAGIEMLLNGTAPEGMVGFTSGALFNDCYDVVGYINQWY